MQRHCGGQNWNVGWQMKKGQVLPMTVGVVTLAACIGAGAGGGQPKVGGQTAHVAL